MGIKSNCPKQWMAFEAWLGFSCHKLTWYVYTDIKLVKLIHFAIPDHITFPCHLSLFEAFLMLILAKNIHEFSHMNIYRHCANGAPGSGSEQQTKLKSSAGLLSLRVTQHPDHKHKRWVSIGWWCPKRPSDWSSSWLTTKRFGWNFLIITTLLNCIISNHNNWMNVALLLVQALFCVKSNVY